MRITVRIGPKLPTWLFVILIMTGFTLSPWVAPRPLSAAANTSLTGFEGFFGAGAVVLNSLGHNVASDGTCKLTVAGDLPATDPLIGPLADNGGATKTHALFALSPALDAADSAACPATDQRGVARPQGSACDSGSFEVDGTGSAAALNQSDPPNGQSVYLPALQR